MKQIIKASSGIMKMLGKAKQPDCGYRLMKYCLAQECEDGTLLFNLLTRELLLLEGKEAEDLLALPELRRRWFVVPERTNEKELVDMVRWISGSVRGRSGETTGYTILTTTHCNARCFYCYERGCAKTTMSPETADQTVDYITRHCGGKKVKISWFGGEPLVNAAVIDRISRGLLENGVEYEATMVSNAYLFDEAVVSRAVKLWNLKRVQITLDGTEEVYNRSKAYVYQQGSAYQVVIANIGRILDAGIAVSIRLNMDLYNAEDLMNLLDELSWRFGGRKNLRIYSHLLFDTEKAPEERNTPEDWIRLYDYQSRLQEKIEQICPSAGRRGLRRELPTNHCMADSGSSLVITPEGRLGLCEHYTDSNFCGSVDSEELDQTVVASWKELRDPFPECADCFYYPECYVLKRCPNHEVCLEMERTDNRNKILRAMQNEYRRWCSGTGDATEPVDGGDENC